MVRLSFRASIFLPVEFIWKFPWVMSGTGEMGKKQTFIIFDSVRYSISDAWLHFFIRVPRGDRKSASTFPPIP